MPVPPVDYTFVGVPREELREWRSLGTYAESGTEPDEHAGSTISVSQATGHARAPIEDASDDFRSIRQDVYNRLYQAYNGPIQSDVSQHLSQQCIRANEFIFEIGRHADGPIDLPIGPSSVRGVMNWALYEAGSNENERQFLLDKLAPHSERSNIAFIQREVKDRINRIHDGRLIGRVSEEMARICIYAGEILDNSVKSIGRDYPVFHEANVRQIMKSALTEAGMPLTECEHLIDLMARSGARTLETIDFPESRPPVSPQLITEAARLSPSRFVSPTHPERPEVANYRGRDRSREMAGR